MSEKESAGIMFKRAMDKLFGSIGQGSKKHDASKAVRDNEVLRCVLISENEAKKKGIEFHGKTRVTKGNVTYILKTQD